MQAGNDNALLRDYVENRSEEAFAALVAHHLNLVYAVALRCVGNAHQAEEISQAVFIIFARKAPQLRHHRALSSWLFQTTRLTAGNFLRTEIRRQRREQEAYMQSTLNESTADPTAQISPLLDTAVEALGETDRRAVVLRFYEGRSLRDVGLALGASEAAAEKRVTRAVEKLRVFLGKHGVALSAAAIAAAVSANSAPAAPVGLAKTISTVAAAKGATASASTLTIAHGALKVMAWVNIKMAAVVSVGVLLAAAGGTELYLSQSSDAEGAHVPRNDWKPSGAATPEAALKTMLSAKTLGDYQTFKALFPALAEDIENDFLKNTTDQQKSDWAAASIKTLQGYTIQKRTVLPDGQIVLTLNFDCHPKTDFSIETYTNSGGEWKCSSAEERSQGFYFRFPSLKNGEFSPRPGSELQGFWAGTITTPNGELHHYVKISEPYAGTFRADFYPIDPGNARLATEVSYDGGKVKLLPVGGLHGRFEGTLPKGGAAMTGKWIQYGRNFPATFKRANR